MWHGASAIWDMFIKEDQDDSPCAPFPLLPPLIDDPAELTEPELLIVFKDELDLSSYPPWHIRLTEI